MAPRHNFNGIRNEFARRQRKTHAFMVHGKAVAHGNGRKLQGRAARHAYTGFYRICQAVQVHMPGNNFAGGIHNTYQRTIHLFSGEAQSIEQGAVRGFFQPGLHFFAACFIIHGGILVV